MNSTFSMLNKTCLIPLVELTWCGLLTSYGGPNLHLISLVRLRPSFVRTFDLLVLWSTCLNLPWCLWLDERLRRGVYESPYCYHLLRLMLDLTSSSFGRTCCIWTSIFYLKMRLVLDLAWFSINETCHIQSFFFGWWLDKISLALLGHDVLYLRLTWCRLDFASLHGVCLIYTLYGVSVDFLSTFSTCPS